MEAKIAKIILLLILIAILAVLESTIDLTLGTVDSSVKINKKYIVDNVVKRVSGAIVGIYIYINFFVE
ncbi:MAG: hypothetical protein WC823_06815 [Parcubacteria group bacterium]|jgi:hypothetical protein